MDTGTVDFVQLEQGGGKQHQDSERAETRERWWNQIGFLIFTK